MRGCAGRVLGVHLLQGVLPDPAQTGDRAAPRQELLERGERHGCTPFRRRDRRPSVHRTITARRPGRTIQVSRLVREQFPGTCPRRVARLQTRHMNPVVALGSPPLSLARRTRWCCCARTSAASAGCWWLTASASAPARQPGHAAPAEPGMVVDQLAAGSWVFLFLWLVLIAYLLPDGHTLSPGWRRWMLVGLVGVAAFLVGAAGDAERVPGGPRRRRPAAVLAAGTGLRPSSAWSAWCSPCCCSSAPCSRSAPGCAGPPATPGCSCCGWSGERPACPLALVLAWVGHFVLDDNRCVVDVALALAGVALPVTIGIAILRHRLFDIQLVLSRTLTYGVLVGAVVALYALLLFGAERLLGRQHGGRPARRRGRRGRGAARRTRCCAGGSSGGSTATASDPAAPCGGSARASSRPTRSTWSTPSPRRSPTRSRSTGSG